MKIIAGKHRGRKLEAPKGSEVRPTPGAVREAVFNILQKYPMAGARVMDVFCGTGAMGLEALSRGAAFAAFVDSSRASLETARKNAAALGETGSCEFILSPAEKLPPARESFDFIFLDPPYFKDLIPPALSSLAAGGYLHGKTLIMAETSSRERKPPLEGFGVMVEREYGNARVLLLGTVFKF